MERDVTEAFLVDGVRQCLRLQGDACILDDRTAGDRVLIDGAVVHEDHDAILIGKHFDTSAGLCVAEDRIGLAFVMLKQERVVEAGDFPSLRMAPFSCD
mgnify:CR=1 FL=1